MFPEMRRALTKLEYGADRIARAAGAPALVGPDDGKSYRFPDEDILQVIAVKAVRIVSGLNATFRLIENGFAVEAAVVLRTVDDFIDEITFLIKGIRVVHPPAPIKTSSNTSLRKRWSPPKQCSRIDHVPIVSSERTFRRVKRATSTP